MFLTDFPIWINGFGFSAMVLCALGLLVAPRRLRAVRTACIVTSCTFFYLALRILFDTFVSIDSPLYLGHGPEYRAMLGMTTAIPVCLIFVEISHYRHVNLLFVAKHFAIPVALMTAFTIAAYMDIEPVLPIIFRLYVLNILIFTLYHFWRTTQAGRRYQSELLEIYVTSEDRSITWFWWVSAAGLALFAGNVIFSLFWNSSLIGDLYHFASTFLWVIVAYRIATLRDATIPYEDEEVPVQASEETLDVSAAVAVEANDDLPSSPVINVQAETDQFMRDLRKTLEEDDLLFDEDLNRDMVTRKMAVTHITLGRRLREATGMSFAAYVCDLRLEHLADLLLSSNDSIDKIYYSCGFRSRATFYRAFARKYNCSPAEYRRNGQI